MAKQTKAEKTAADIAAAKQQINEGTIEKKRTPLTETGIENAIISKYHRRKMRWLERHPDYKTKVVLMVEERLSTEDVKTDTTTNTDAQ